MRENSFMKKKKINLEETKRGKVRTVGICKIGGMGGKIVVKEL
jgi:hypothetical protein